MPAGSPGPGARPHLWCPTAAPPLPGRVAWSWSVLGEVGARARREGARGRVGVGQRLPARIPGARQGPRSSRAEDLRGTERAASPELRADGPRLGRWPPARPASSPAPWAHAVVAGAAVRARAAVRSSPSPGARRLCARGAPAAAASSGCCSRRRLPLLLLRRPLPAFPAGPEAAAESRSG